MEALQDSLAQLQDMFTRRMDSYQGELQNATPSLNVSNLTADFTAFRAFIMTALHTLQDQVSLLARQVDGIEMRSRRKMLLIHGLPEKTDEDAAAVAVGAVVGRMKLSISAKDIGRCHRMGRATASDRPRPMLVKLHDLDVRNKIWHAKTTLKGSGITISEFLTKPRHDTFMAARQKFGVTKCFTRQGFVFVVSPDGKRSRVSSLAELQKIAVVDAPKPVAAAARVPEPAVPKTRRAGGISKK